VPQPFPRLLGLPITFRTALYPSDACVIQTAAPSGAAHQASHRGILVFHYSVSRPFTQNVFKRYVEWLRRKVPDAHFTLKIRNFGPKSECCLPAEVWPLRHCCKGAVSFRTHHKRTVREWQLSFCHLQ
jgi:hypothetical protein